MNWRINRKAINIVIVHLVYENDWYEIYGKMSHYYIEGWTDMGIIFKHCFVK